jgi:hypothetical protein
MVRTLEVNLERMLSVDALCTIFMVIPTPSMQLTGAFHCY